MPFDDTVKAEAYRGVAVGEDTGYPWVSLFNVDRQFFLQLAFKGASQRFPSIHLAAGKFPVPCIGFTLRAAGEKKTSVCVGDNRDRYIDNRMRMRHGGVRKWSSGGLQKSIHPGKGARDERNPAIRVELAHHYDAAVLLNVSGSEENLYRDTPADGVHFSSAQLMSLQTRPDCGWCGASCHNAEELARAEQLELDFAVLAPVLPTLSHPGSPTLGWQKFAALIRNCSIPVYALGGLRPEDLTTAWEHGAHGIALMRAMGD